MAIHPGPASYSLCTAAICAVLRNPRALTGLIHLLMDDLLGSRNMRTVLSMFVAVGALSATEVLAQAPASVFQSGRELRPPSEAGKASRAARAQAQRPDRRSALDARAERRAVAPAAFDGSWSVAINTHSGACEPHYRFGVEIING